MHSTRRRQIRYNRQVLVVWKPQSRRWWTRWPRSIRFRRSSPNSNRYHVSVSSPSRSSWLLSWMWTRPRVTKTSEALVCCQPAQVKKSKLPSLRIENSMNSYWLWALTLSVMTSCLRRLVRVKLSSTKSLPLPSTWILSRHLRECSVPKASCPTLSRAPWWSPINFWPRLKSLSRAWSSSESMTPPPSCPSSASAISLMSSCKRT